MSIHCATPTQLLRARRGCATVNVRDNLSDMEQRDVVAAIFEGASPNMFVLGDSMSLLEYVEEREWPDAIAALLEHNVSASHERIRALALATDRESWTPMHFAACYGYMHALDRLLAAGANPDVMSQWSGTTPFMEAVKRNEYAAEAIRGYKEKRCERALRRTLARAKRAGNRVCL